MIAAVFLGATRRLFLLFLRTFRHTTLLLLLRLGTRWWTWIRLARVWFFRLLADRLGLALGRWLAALLFFLTRVFLFTRILLARVLAQILAAWQFGGVDNFTWYRAGLVHWLGAIVPSLDRALVDTQVAIFLLLARRRPADFRLFLRFAALVWRRFGAPVRRRFAAGGVHSDRGLVFQCVRKNGFLPRRAGYLNVSLTGQFPATIDVVCSPTVCRRCPDRVVPRVVFTTTRPDKLGTFHTVRRLPAITLRRVSGTERVFLTLGKRRLGSANPPAGLTFESLLAVWWTSYRFATRQHCLITTRLFSCFTTNLLSRVVLLGWFLTWHRCGAFLRA